MYRRGYMIWKLYESRFPNASRFERRRKVTALVLAVVGAIILVAAVVFVMK